MNRTIALLATLALPVALAALAESAKDTDKDFYTKAAQAGMAEVATGQLAISNGSDQKIKEFGKQMVDDHTKAGNELTSIAQRDGVTLPSEATKAQQDAAQKLSAKSGHAFDVAYAHMAVKDHEEAVALFKQEASSGKEADMKAFAQKTLPTLEQHLKMAKELPGAAAKAE